jgi:glucose-1-phosphate thymidylyltransferase
MKIIVPMAGRGSRLRPHTITVPKPLIPVAGKPIVHRLVEDIARVCGQQIEEVAFVIGDFGKEVENELVAVANKLGAKGTIYYQDEPLGTAHAVLCAAESLHGPVIVAFADTLFRADFHLDAQADGIIWVNRIEDPRSFGVVKLADDNRITDFVEKPQEFISDLAIIGIYYFRDGMNLRGELQYLIDNNIREKGEYQITNALDNMKNKGLKFYPGQVDEWLDCGNKEVTVYTNQRVLSYTPDARGSRRNLNQSNAVIVEPCFIGNDVELANCVVGPYVSLGNGVKVSDSVVRNAIVQDKAVIRGLVVADSMIGKNANVHGNPKDLSVGDYTSFTV